MVKLEHGMNRISLVALLMDDYKTPTKVEWNDKEDVRVYLIEREDGSGRSFNVRISFVELGVVYTTMIHIRTS